MRITELIKKLSDEKDKNGDIETILMIDYCGGDYGSHNCLIQGIIELVTMSGENIVLSGREII